MVLAPSLLAVFVGVLAAVVAPTAAAPSPRRVAVDVAVASSADSTVDTTTTTTTDAAAAAADTPTATDSAANLGVVNAAAAAGACTVTIPANALTATGLSTPWFAECAVVDTTTGTVSIYPPLLINKGQAFITPTVPTLPANNVVGCWFGTNGVSTTLVDANNGNDLAAAKCVNGIAGSIFGQFATCNGQAFFTAANAAKPTIAALGTGNNGKTCYTTRSFQLIDMDPSDNMVTTYLVNANNKIGQKTTANAKTLTTELNNGSDNVLLDAFMRPALGCTAFTATNLADPTGPQVGALALNELQAAALQATPIAFVPPNDPMVLDNNAAMNTQKLNNYRTAVNQPAVNAATTADATTFCQNMLSISGPSIFTDMQFTAGFTTPDAANGKDLFTFLGQRYQASWMGLGCMDLVQVTYLNKTVTAPIIANRDGNGVTQSLTANTAALAALAKGTTASTTSKAAAASTTTSKTTASSTTKKTSTTAAAATTTTAKTSTTKATKTTTTAAAASATTTAAAATTAKTSTTKATKTTTTAAAAATTTTAKTSTTKATKTTTTGNGFAGSGTVFVTVTVTSVVVVTQTV